MATFREKRPKMDCIADDCKFTTAGQAVLDIEELLEHTFSMMSAYELNQMARVCKKWRDVANRIKKSRHGAAWFAFDATEEGDMETQVGVKFKHLAAEPKTAVLFASTMLFENKVAVPSKHCENSRPRRAAKQEKLSLTDYLKRLLPKSCSIVGCTTDGVVGTLPERLELREMENSVSASCFLFPQIEGVDIYTFTARADLEDSLGSFHPSAETPEPDPAKIAQVTNIPADKKVRLVLLLETEQRRLSVDADLAYAILKRYKNVVVAGGYVDHLLPDDDTEGNYADNNVCAAISNGIAFCGEGIKVASVVVGNNVCTPKQVEEKLKKLKATHIPMARTYGFMFACIGRGAYFYKKVSVESEEFKKIFPNTPLFGFFGNGEIGYDYLPDYSRPEGDSEMSVEGSYPDDDAPYVWDLPELYHAYTTIFVLLSLPS